MAVSIDTVYQRVLALANKEQRGYITPLEFNLLANQAQMEIFEQYFYDINLYNRAPANSTEYADMLHILEEKIAPFKINDTALTASTYKFEDTFELDITDWSEVVAGNGVISHEAPSSTNSYNGGLKILQNANSAIHIAESGVNFSLTAGKQYVVSWEIIDMDEPAFYNVYIDDGGSQAIGHSVHEPSIGSFNFTFTADTTGNHNIRLQNGDTTDAGKYITFGSISVKEVDDTTIGDGGTNTLYRLGEVMWKRSGQSYPTQVPEVRATEITKYNVSPLARPTSSNPVYVRTKANKIQLYPTPTATDTITHNFVKKPKDVYWGYVIVPQSSGGNEYPMYNAAATQDFELHESEEMPLVYKILELGGIVINKPGLVQAASLEQQENLQNEKQ